MNRPDPRRLLRRAVERITLHPRTVILLILLITAFFASSLPGIYIENERKLQLPANHPIIRLDDEILEIFGGGKYAIVAVEPVEGDVFQPWVLEKIRAITEGLASLPGVTPDRVLSLMSARVKSIEAGGPEEIVVGPLVPQIPRTPEESESLRRRVMQERLFVGFLVSEDGRAASVSLDRDDLDPNPDLRNSVLDRRIRDLLASLEDPRLKTYISGVPFFIATMDGYTRYVLKLFALAVLVIGLVHFAAFRTFQAMFLPLVTALLSVVWGLGIFGHLKMPMDGWNALSPFLILAVAAGHAVQILKRYYEEYRRLGDNRAAVVESTVRVGVVMITAGVTAAAGLFSLMLFPIRSIQVFGFLSGAGILSALVIEMTFIPACRTLLPPPRRKEIAAEQHGGLLETALEALAHTVTRRPWLSLGIAAAVLAASGLGATRLRVENSFREALPRNDPGLEDFETINRLFGGSVTLNVLVEGEGEDALYDPELLRFVEGMQRHLESIPGIGRPLSIVDYVKQMNVAFNGGEEAFRRIPDTRQTVAQFFLLYSGDPEDFEMMADAGYRTAVIRAFSRLDNATFCEEVFSGARAYAADQTPAGVRVGIAGGGLAIGKAVNDVIMQEKIRNAAVVAGIIFLISSLVLRSLVGGAMVLVPSLFAAIVNLGLMGGIGTWLNLATASISSLTVSIGADYAIYFLFRFREEYARAGDIREATLATMLTSGKAIFFVASAIASGSLVMTLSPLAYHKQLGAYVASSMFTSSLAAVTVVPSLVILLRPRFLRRRAGAAPRAAETDPGRPASAPEPADDLLGPSDLPPGKGLDPADDARERQ